jgi:RNA polymerase sigma-70 factor (ECF subfamily)
MTTAYFENHILPLKNQLYRQALWLLKNPQDAEDVVQELMLNLWRKGVSEDIIHIEAYCAKALQNLCIDRLRKQRHMFTKLESGYDEADEETPLVNAIYKDEAKIIDSIISRLPANQQLLIQLRNVEGWPMKKISEVLDMNENAAMVMLSRVRKKIYAEYQKIKSFGNI